MPDLEIRIHQERTDEEQLRLAARHLHEDLVRAWVMLAVGAKTKRR